MTLVVIVPSMAMDDQKRDADGKFGSGGGLHRSELKLTAEQRANGSKANYVRKMKEKDARQGRTSAVSSSWSDKDAADLKEAKKGWSSQPDNSVPMKGRGYQGRGPVGRDEAPDAFTMTGEAGRQARDEARRHR